MERPNVARPILWDFEIWNIKITKVELFDFPIFDFFLFLWLFKLLENSKYIYDNLPWNSKFCEIFKVLQIVKFWKYAHFWNLTISEIWLFYEFVDNVNLIILEIVKFGKFLDFFFQFRKPQFDSENWQILGWLVHSIFRIIRNFANSHICSLKF